MRDDGVWNRCRHRRAKNFEWPLQWRRVWLLLSVNSNHLPALLHHHPDNVPGNYSQYRYIQNCIRLHIWLSTSTQSNPTQKARMTGLPKSGIITNNVHCIRGRNTELSTHHSMDCYLRDIQFKGRHHAEAWEKEILAWVKLGRSTDLLEVPCLPGLSWPGHAH